MREEKKLKKIAKDRLQPLCDDITKQLETEFPDAAVNDKRTHVRKRRVAIWSSLASVACCAVILLCVFLVPTSAGKPNPNNKNDWDMSGSGSAGSKYSVVASDLTIKEYNLANGTDFLYLDRYAEASACSTKLYLDRQSQALIGIEETFKIGDMQILLQSAIVPLTVDIIKDKVDKCTYSKQLDSYEIKWAVLDTDCCGAFVYEGRQYCLTVKSSSDEQQLFELIEELFA
ncbi:MAG: hypothetical protein J1F69_03880 [Clostridiales bacterium]|nr:hypothetical protein [Clostridiales bacterium]